MNLVDQIVAANKRIKAATCPVRTTPFELSASFSHELGCEVWLKCEHLQHTGSFKYRGALNKVLLLSKSEREKGVVAASSGNHGQGVALAARHANTMASIYVAENASPMKIKAIENLGANIVKVPGSDAFAAELKAREDAKAQGKVYISPYNDLDVVAGQGTIGLEISEQCDNLDALFVSVGGGGLISGISTYLKSVSPNTEIIGGWPENSPAMYDALEAGKIIESIDLPTLSDGTAGNIENDTVTLQLCQQLIDRKVLVSEDEIKMAMRKVAEYERWMVEGAAGVAMASLMKHSGEFSYKKVGVLLCGRNIGLDKFRGVFPGR